MEFNSHPEFKARIVKRLVDPSLPSKIVHEKYTNEDIEILNQRVPRGPRKKDDSCFVSIDMLESDNEDSDLEQVEDDIENRSQSPK